MKKRILSLLLSGILCLSAIQIMEVPVYAYEYVYGNSTYTYTITGTSSVKITAYTGTDENVEVPEISNGYKVTSIGERSFYNNNYIVNLILPSTLTTIEDYAFYYSKNIETLSISENVSYIGNRIVSDCQSLKNIYVDENNPNYISIDGVLYNADKTELVAYPIAKEDTEYTVFQETKTIDEAAFHYSLNLEYVYLPDGLITVNDDAFYCARKLKEIVIPDSVINIGDRAFSCCRYLEYVYLGKRLENIGDSPFYQSDSLVSIDVSTDNEYFTSDNGVLIGNNGDFLIHYPAKKTDKSYTIPDSVKEIASRAFSNCYNLYTIDTNNVEIFGEYSFYNCVVYYLTVSENASSFKNGYMGQCLKEITFLNTNCEISLSYYGSNGYTVKGYNNSTAQIYAETYDREFVSLGDYLSSAENEDNSTDLESSEKADEKIGDDTYITDEIQSTEHQYISTVIEPTCTEQGYTQHVCAICGDTYKDNYIDSLGHNIVIDEALAATCTTSGLTQGSHCSICNEVFEEQKVIPATDHLYDNGVVKVKATCIKNGTKVYTCKNCNYSYNVSIPANGHKYVSKVIKASLTSAGNIVTSCSVCGVVKSKTTIAKIKTVTLSKTSYTYTDKNLSKPKVTVKDSNGKTISSSNYTVTYISRATGKTVSSIKAIGQYKVKVVFKGNYSGTKYLYFSVKPKKEAIKTPTTGSKHVTAKWTKDSSVTGYQVVIATDSKFTKNKKAITISKNSTTSYKFTKLTKGKKYYIKIRSYKTIKVDGRTAKMYSDYSCVKSIVCK